jgi:HK97 family phage portal protein
MITVRDSYGVPTMAEWLNPQDVTVDEGNLAGVGSYMNPVWWWRGRRMNTEDVIHIPWFCLPYKVRGLSPIGAYKVTANVELGAEEYAAAWFNNGGVPPGTFRNSAQVVSKDDADLITARITNRLQTRKPLVFGKDWEYTPIAIKPNEAQFVETMRLTATHIAVIYGIPPEKIGGSTGSSLTYSTVEQNSLDFLTFSLRPWLVRIEKALSELFPRGTFVRFDTDDLLRTDAKTRAEIDALTLGHWPPGYRTIDEVRQGNDLPPVDPAKLPPPYRPGSPEQSTTDGPQQPSTPSTNGKIPFTVPN